MDVDSIRTQSIEKHVQMFLCKGFFSFNTWNVLIFFFNLLRI